MRLRRENIGILVGSQVAGNDGRARVPYQVFGFDLRTHGADRGGRGADENASRRGAGVGKFCVLRQEAVTGMHGIRPGRDDSPHYRLDVQVTCRRHRRTNPYRPVSLPNVQRIGIRIGIDGDGLDAKSARGTHDAAGDLAPIGDKQGSDHVATS